MQGITNSAGSIIGLNSDLTLLWENPNPNNSFDAQTINVNSSKFRYVVIKMKYYYNYTSPLDGSEYRYQINIILDKEDSVLMSSSKIKLVVDSARRYITNLSNESITFDVGYESGNDNRKAIPLAIYGCNNASIEESPSVGAKLNIYHLKYDVSGINYTNRDGINPITITIGNVIPTKMNLYVLYMYLGYTISIKINGETFKSITAGENTGALLGNIFEYDLPSTLKKNDVITITGGRQSSSSGGGTMTADIILFNA